jgi:nucleoside-diphosphate-sugar epimerase
VENVAEAIALAVTHERASGRIYNVGELYTPTLTERVSKLGQIAGWQGKVVVVPRDHLPTHLMVDIDTSQDIVVDTSRIREELGYAEIIPYDEALRRTIEWEQRHPPDLIDPGQFDYPAEDTVLARIGK